MTKRNESEALSEEAKRKRRAELPGDIAQIVLLLIAIGCGAWSYLIQAGMI